MKSFFSPDLKVESLLEIDLNGLKRRRLDGMILDLDNTIISWDSEAMPEEIQQWMESLHAEGIKLCLVSNNFSGRVGKIANICRTPYVARAYKPLRFGFQRALEQLQLPAVRVAVVGDQLFTDIWGGNRMGMFTILTPPLSEREFITTKWMRYLERWLMKRCE